MTLIARPRRFGKTLNMSMLENFFSVDYAGRGDLFEGLSVWENERYRALQGTYPVISLSFANVKENNYQTTCYRIRQLLMKLYEKYAFLRDCELLSDAEKDYFDRMRSGMSEEDAPLAIYQLSDFLYRYYGKKVIILLDEYDTPMQEAMCHVFEENVTCSSRPFAKGKSCMGGEFPVDGYWDEIVSFTRSLFNSTFKTNPYLERAVMTGITRVSKESIFSDLNNLEVVTTTSDVYATAFGFTEGEVFEALDEYGYGDQKDDVKYWYDGFIFGKHKDIYNPWSILNFLRKGEFTTYWANTSSNALVSKLLREGSVTVKSTFEKLLDGETICCPIDEQIVYNQLDNDEDAVWSLLVAGGYLKVLDREKKVSGKQQMYTLDITNAEVRDMFCDLVRGWFTADKTDYNGFVQGLLACDLDAMNAYILEFKVFNTRREQTLEDTVAAAHAQIEEKKYETALTAKGIPSEHIYKYGFAFKGKHVLIG